MCVCVCVCANAFFVPLFASQGVGLLFASFAFFFCICFAFSFLLLWPSMDKLVSHHFDKGGGAMHLFASHLFAVPACIPPPLLLQQPLQSFTSLSLYPFPGLHSPPFHAPPACRTPTLPIRCCKRIWRTFSTS